MSWLLNVWSVSRDTGFYVSLPNHKTLLSIIMCTQTFFFACLSISACPFLDAAYPYCIFYAVILQQVATAFWELELTPLRVSFWVLELMPLRVLWTICPQINRYSHLQWDSELCFYWCVSLGAQHQLSRPILCQQWTPDMHTSLTRLMYCLLLLRSVEELFLMISQVRSALAIFLIS